MTSDAILFTIIAIISVAIVGLIIAALFFDGDDF
jgi:hypothetical protein